MATISEDYVSFETAKLLKEKGFDESLSMVYMSNGDLCKLNRYDSIRNSNYNDITKNYFEYTAPTIQMAIKWLRKEHNLCIVSLPLVTNDEGEGGCLWKYSISMKLKVLFDSGSLYESPKIALDDAIKRCCENLI